MSRPEVPEGSAYDRVRLMQRALGGPLWGGAKLIFEERERQIVREGWSEDHDIEHGDGELLDAALCYATREQDREYSGRWWHFRTPIPTAWPWSSEFWKPTPHDRIRELVKAGALIAAEIDRLQAVHATSSTAPLEAP